MGTIKVVVMGGTTRFGSSTENALRVTADRLQELGAEVQVFGGSKLARLPLYDPSSPRLTLDAEALIDALYHADGIVMGSPSYHGTISGLVKNALDYVEELSKRDPPYFSGRAVGCIATGYGWQATVTTLGTMRTIVHALRGWPTPYGAAINTQLVKISPSGHCDPVTLGGLRLIGDEVFHFCSSHMSAMSPAESELTVNDSPALVTSR